MDRVARWLRDDPQARAELAQIERSLKPLEESFRVVEPPPADLISKTLANLPPGGPLEEGEATPTLAPMRVEIDPPPDSSVSWLDWVGGVTAAVIIMGLLLPSLAQGRFESRKAACQDQLREFGLAITRFVNQNPQERLPAVAEEGPEAFAGVYAVRLDETGLIGDPSLRWCPSLDVPGQHEVALTGLNEIASVEDLHAASVDRLRQIQRFVGGHYAYTLGVIEHDRLASPRYESRSSFAVMSDAPLTGVSTAEDWSRRVGHSGTGINVLFEDGRVQFIPVSSLDSMPDHPLLNHHGEVEAGVNIDDASLAPSWRPPFVNVRQR